MRRRAGLIIVAAVSVAACGSSSPTADPGTVPPEAATDEPVAITTEAPTPTEPFPTGTEPTEPTEGDNDVSGDQTVAPPPEPDEPADEPDEPDEPADEPADPPVVALPDDGCSLDNSPTTAEAAAGPPPVIEVRAESAVNPLPDLAVRRINCAGGWVNLKNELPSERPLLVWFWAPH